MVENNVLAEKTIEFAIRIVNCYKYLVKRKHETVMAKQVSILKIIASTIKTSKINEQQHV